MYLISYFIDQNIVNFEIRSVIKLKYVFIF